MKLSGITGDPANRLSIALPGMSHRVRQRPCMSRSKDIPAGEGTALQAFSKLLKDAVKAPAASI